MVEALAWGALAASSLIVGALLGLARPWPERAVGVVLAFGAGALISAVSFDLAEEGVELGGGDSVALGLALGALTYFLADRAVERLGQPQRAGPSAAAASTPDGGTALALGAFLDGIPEQMVLGIGLATGDGVSIGLLAAIFISNLPEAAGSATEMRAAGRSRAAICGLWTIVALICTLATVVGLRHRRRRLRRPPSHHQRLRGRGPAGHADRLHDPGVRPPGREGGRSGHRPRLRGRRWALRRELRDGMVTSRLRAFRGAAG